MHRIAHTLKSNAATFGCDDLALACRELERAAGGVAADSQQLIERVEGEAARRHRRRSRPLETIASVTTPG